MAPSFADIDAYIATFPADVQLILEEVRGTLHTAVPDAGETISYQMPTITLDGRSLVYFAAWKNHLGMYPIPAADGPLEARIAPYRAATDSVRFPYRQPIPYELIAEIAALLVERRSAADVADVADGS